MDKLVRNWLIALSGASILGAGVLAGGVGVMSTGGRSPFVSGLGISALGTSFLALVAWNWFKFLKGRVLYEKSLFVPLAGGSLTVPVPEVPFELWIFCSASFAQFHGEIVVTLGDSRYTILVPKRNPLIYPVRSNLQPIVWRPLTWRKELPKECRVTFDLSETFPESVFDRREQGGNMEMVTVLLKTI